MQVIEIGDLDVFKGNFTGLLIAATPNEIRKIAGNVLYHDVIVVPTDGEQRREPAKSDFDQQKRFSEQIERCGEIMARLHKDRRKKYSVAEVEAIIDELLDGVKPGEEEKSGQDVKGGIHASTSWCAACGKVSCPDHGKDLIVPCKDFIREKEKTDHECK